MRDIGLWGCPYRLKCQSVQVCEHFTLTGRIDEYSNIKDKKKTLQNAKIQILHSISPKSIHDNMLKNIDDSLQYLESMETEWQQRAESQYLIDVNNLLSKNTNTEGEIKTLAALFALEHNQLKKDN
ncbi:hypothetical protein [Xenorhabdus budapestensis]|nr:hypothetical protein [Xenorhabdus budapestensis]